MLTTSGQNASLLTVFNDCKVKYMVVGGLAVNYYCSNREVGDLDLLVSPTTKNAINIAQAFAKLDSQGLKEIDLCKLDYRKFSSEFGVQVPLKKFLNADILTPINIAQAFAKLDSQGLKEIDLCKLDYRKLSEFGVQVPLKKFLNADILTPLPEFDFCTSYINCIAPGSLDTSLSHAAGLSDIAVCHA